MMAKETLSFMYLVKLMYLI